MGHIAHLRNQFKSMNTFKRSYDYIYRKTGPVVQKEKILNFLKVLLQFCYHIPMLKGVVFPFEQTQILFTQGCFLLSLVEIGPVVLQKIFLKFCQCFFTIS